MASQQELRANAQRVFDRLRTNLLQSLQVGNPRTFAHGNPRANLTYRSPYSTVGQGLSLQNGRMPNDAEIAAYVQSQPEYRQAVKSMKRAGAKGAGVAPSGPSFDGGQVSSTPAQNYGGQSASPSMQLFNEYFGGVQQDFNEAKAANLARYDEGHGELTGTRDYRQQLYQNFGQAASADIDERLQENLKTIKSDAARRGLGNSNVPMAFSQRAGRDSAREQQRVREMRDSRLADAYAQDTNNLVGFIERREDPYPDVNQALQLGLQLSESEANRQAQERRLAMDRQLAANALRGTGGRGRSDVRLPPIPGPQGGSVPYFANGTPLQMANGFFAGGGGGPAYTSNRYPTRRSPEEYAAIQQNRMMQQNPNALEQDRNAWFSGRRSMPTPLPFPTYA
jgi:hypothetical protein